jgi:16S rRNA (guanine966-N2)-methyltransferase
MHIIAGTLKNRIIRCPKNNVTRPTSSRLREALCNICQNYIEGAVFLDLFAGSGAMGLETLSRGTAKCTFIDNSTESIRCIQKNLENFHLTSKGRVLFGNVFSWIAKLSKQGERYDLIYADPPYDRTSLNEEGKEISYSQRLLTYLDQHSLLQPSAMLFIEDSTDFCPDVGALPTLKLISSRRSGRSILYQFQQR